MIAGQAGEGSGHFKTRLCALRDLRGEIRGAPQPFDPSGQAFGPFGSDDACKRGG